MAKRKFSTHSNDSSFSGKKRHGLIDGEPLMEAPRPLSLIMGPPVIEANAMGDPEARAIVESWRPSFVIISGSVQEFSSWTL